MNRRCQIQIPGVCGAWPPICTHHRKLRKHGGDDSVSNLITVCGPCHAYVHNHPTESYEHGWLVKSHDDPSTVAWWKA